LGWPETRRFQVSASRTGTPPNRSLHASVRPLPEEELNVAHASAQAAQCITCVHRSRFVTLQITQLLQSSASIGLFDGPACTTWCVKKAKKTDRILCWGAVKPQLNSYPADGCFLRVLVAGGGILANCRRAGRTPRARGRLIFWSLSIGWNPRPMSLTTRRRSIRNNFLRWHYVYFVRCVAVRRTSLGFRGEDPLESERKRTG
jgi:hypothetical protein